ncbi:MAG: spore coat protein CotJB [Lachnospiraceae bacterium]
MRNAALKEYERLYGPLTLDTARDSIHDSFVWSQQPWPWEGGAC